jgi:glycosyltransferase involved in cell wall biosynthesis
MLASRLLWDKGVAEFVEAARRLGSRARFVLVGMPDPGNPTAVPEAQLEAWKKEGVIEWWGAREDMPQVLRQAAVFCLPSYREGMPKVLLEAMATGLACVTSDAPGCRDAVEDQVSGLLVPPRDAAGLTAAIDRLLSDGDLRARLGGAARRRAVSHFASERAINATLQIYRDLTY